MIHCKDHHGMYMKINKHTIAAKLLPIFNRLLSPIKLKLITKNTPNRDFHAFIKHLDKLNFNIKTVIDVGVAFGSPGLYKALPQAKFYLVEPVPQCKGVLEKLKETMGATYFHVAAGDEDGETDFFVHNDISGSSSLRQWEGDFLDGEKIRVPLRRLDTLISEPIARPSLLKIDTQGNELKVLRGAVNILDSIDVVLLETSFHEFRKGAPEIHEIVKTMTDLGYRCYEVLEGHYREIDNAMAQVDVAFVKEDSVLRSSKCYFSQTQSSDYIKHYEKANLIANNS